MLTSTYSAHMSILPTKLHTWLTVHELISSLWAWHRRGLATGDALADKFVAMPGVWARFFAAWDTFSAVGEGDDALRFGLDSIFNRLPPTGVDALKSSGDEGRGRLLLDVDAADVDWLDDAFTPNAGLISEDAFCCIVRNCSGFGTLGGNGIRFCGDVVEFGDCCERNEFEWMGGVWRLFSRLGGPFKMCCLISFSFAACACRMFSV